MIETGHRIHQLPQAVADAIAAGEVVERPASVVKELCENALDAGATRIDIDIEGGGLVRIAVHDNGSGINPDELPLAVARHATSKIGTANDLTHVSTLGFRGEALASIAAVSDVSITSATVGRSAAATLSVHGGAVGVVEATAAPVGTTVVVSNLFFNTPARRHFLRAEKAEIAAAVHIVSDLILACPTVAFTCRTEGRVALRSLGGGEIRDAAVAVFGRGSGEQLLDVSEDGAIAVSGCIAEPRAHRGNRNGLVLVVNGRRIHNRPLLFAVEDAYRGVLPTGRYPFGILSVSLDPESIDVNVHPTKREIRFRDERSVFRAVQHACWQALSRAAAYTVAVSGSPQGEESVGTYLPQDLGMALVMNDADSHYRPSASEDISQPQLSSIPGNDEVAALAPLRTLGQTGNTWVVAESPRGVILVDPHAAHEKILYTQLLERWRSSEVKSGHVESENSQLLLFAETVECDAGQLEVLATQSDFLSRCGFSLEPFGPGLVRCVAIPSTSRDANIRELVTNVLDSLREGGGQDVERQHRTAAVVACHSAVRFGDVLELSEQQRLLEQLIQTPGALTCPHGRPTVLILDDPSLRRAFRRPVV